MYDSFNRRIHYLRISVTDRCNLRCTYCMPEEGIQLLNHSNILSLEEMAAFTDVAVKNGIDKVRITGGEPLVRKGIVDFVKLLAGIEGIKDLSMTTNGVSLGHFAPLLKEAGLHRINISLDTINAEKFKTITRGGDLNQVLDGVNAAIRAGLQPVKINCVVEKYPDEPDAMAVKSYCDALGIQVRFIPKMDLERGNYQTVIGGTGGNCALCNRLRLSSDGWLRPCLFNNNKFNIRELGFEQAILQAVEAKPSCGSFSTENKFNEIGG
ncbi:MAG: radical SAM protein [Bacteroidota bacterium]